MRGRVWIVVLALMLAGCASRPMAAERTLKAPAYAIPAAAAAMEEGNRLFGGRQLEAAKLQYQEAIKAQPTLAEAHYNLALVYDFLRDDATAKHHYIEAANLAPGHKVIWDAPPLRRHGDVEAHPKGSDTLYLPTVGGR
ncbi:MAG: tetratricopeptide repeat protein [Nitrospirota bacterium]|nr:tetratricopeptide repeat protein [Nitrospirota bacterium]